MVDDQPETGQDKRDHLEQQGWVAETVDGQAADGAHGAHKQVANAVRSCKLLILSQGVDVLTCFRLLKNVIWVVLG